MFARYSPGGPLPRVHIQALSSMTLPHSCNYVRGSDRTYSQL